MAGGHFAVAAFVALLQIGKDAIVKKAVNVGGGFAVKQKEMAGEPTRIDSALEKMPLANRRHAR